MKTKEMVTILTNFGFEEVKSGIFENVIPKYRSGERIQIDIKKFNLVPRCYNRDGQTYSKIQLVNWDYLEEWLTDITKNDRTNYIATVIKDDGDGWSEQSYVYSPIELKTLMWDASQTIISKDGEVIIYSKVPDWGKGNMIPQIATLENGTEQNITLDEFVDRYFPFTKYRFSDGHN